MQKFEERESFTLENHGQKIFAVFHQPLIETKAPAVLMCHGLAGHKTGRYRLYVTLSQRLAQEGIASLRFDFRGVGDSEGDLKEMTFEDEVNDAITSLDYLFENSKIDPKRIGVFGRSVGGVIAIIAAQRHGNIKSMAVWAPLFDGKQWDDKWKLIKTNSIPSAHAEEMMRVNGQVVSKAFLHQLFTVKMDQEMSPLGNVPFLHVHGEKDAIIDVAHGNHYEACRKNAGAQSKFLRLPNSDHDFSDPHEQKSAIEETVKWFKETL
jgi:uncharacterized protein